MKKHKYKNSGYSHGGAAVDKPTLKTWFPRHFSSKSDLDLNLSLLRDRAFDLTSNSPIGAAAINTMLSGTISTGLKLFPTPKFRELGLTAEAARRWSRQVQTEFNLWADNLDCDFYHRNNFYELQRIAFQSYLTDGDCFCLFRRRSPKPYTLRLQILESQRVSNPITNGGLINGVEMIYGNNRIINGVEVDKSGKTVAIWVSNRIWNEPATTTPELKYQRVKFIGDNGNQNILHICYDTRAEMFRGAPLLAPVIESLKQVARYSDAELTSAIIKSFFSLFFIQPNSNFNLNEITGETDLDVREYKLGSGTISALPRGVDIKTVESGNTQSTFSPFVEYFIKATGAAIGVPYEVLVNNFQSSYSASRAAILEAEKTFRQRRQAFILDFCKPIYSAWLTEAVATGRIAANGFFDNELTRYLWSNADFRCEISPPIDEVKAVTAAEKRIALGISTREIESVRIGNDFYDVAEQLKFENDLLHFEN